MPAEDSPDVTALLKKANSGDREAEQELYEVVYSRLRDLAAKSLSTERSGHTLQPTALVNEAFLRLLGKKQVNWEDRLHFFSVASRTMRRILVDHARKRLSQKAGGGKVFLELNDELHYLPDSDRMIVRLHDSLSELSNRDQRMGLIVELRYFGGLTEEEIGLLLGVSSRTVKRDWVTARAWLHAELSE